MGSKRKVHVGQVFGGLTVVSELPVYVRPNGKTQGRWLCLCECGKESEVPTANLNSGNTQSCGCRRGKAPNNVDLVGQEFGSLTVISRAESRRQYGTVMGYWLCQCRCSNVVEITTSALTQGQRTTCGCRIDRPKGGYKRTHGHSNKNSAAYRTWTSMWRRCRHRERYNDRGIVVDPRWESFENFLADMGERPDGMTLDRIDNDGPYSPGNCRWATGKTQSNNRSNNRHITFDGRTQTVAEWAREVGLSGQCLYNRVVLYKWPLERALFEKPQSRKAS